MRVCTTFLGVRECPAWLSEDCGPGLRTISCDPCLLTCGQDPSHWNGPGLTPVNEDQGKDFAGWGAHASPAAPAASACCSQGSLCANSLTLCPLEMGLRGSPLALRGASVFLLLELGASRGIALSRRVWQMGLWGRSKPRSPEDRSSLRTANRLGPPCGAWSPRHHCPPGLTADARGCSAESGQAPVGQH